MAFESELAKWMASEYGLDLAVFGQSAVDEALAARCRSLGAQGLEAYVHHWRAEAKERDAFLDGLLVGETWFFREWPAFQMLGEWLVTQGRRFGAENPLRILTLPCASGEEAWSIAAIVQESGLKAGSVLIEAMDINLSALEFAERGRYPQRRLRSQPLARWAHVLHSRERDWLEVAPGLRGMVSFIEANAMDRPFLMARAPYHVIFCRNMLIYMGAEARAQVCSTLVSCLAPDGLLFLGHAEQLPPGLGLARTGADGAFAWQPRQTPTTPASPAPAPRPSSPIRKSISLIARPSRPSPSPSPSLSVRMPVAAPLTDAKASVPSPALNQARQLAPPAVDLEEVRRLADQGRYAEAFNRLDSAEARASLDPEVHSLAGILLGALERKPEAISRLRRALYLDPGHAESLAHLALLIEENGDLAGASRLRARLADPSRVAGA